MYTKIHYQPPKGGAFAPPLPPLNLPLSVFEPMPSLTLKSVLFGFLTSVSANYLPTNQQFMWDLWLKVVPEMLTQGTWVWMLFVHMSKPQVCKKKQLVSVQCGGSGITGHDQSLFFYGTQEKLLECLKKFKRQHNNFLDSTIVHSTFTACQNLDSNLIWSFFSCWLVLYTFWLHVVFIV